MKYTDKGTAALMDYFDNSIIYSVPMSKLIADGTLAKPVNIRRETNVDIETRIDEEEMKRIRRRGGECKIVCVKGLYKSTSVLAY